MTDADDKQVLERPRTAQLLRSVSNSFKKGTDRLKRGLTPRSRTSSQTIEPEDAVPPPPPSAADPSAPPMQLDNHVHVKIAEVDGAAKVKLVSGGTKEKGADGKGAKEEVPQGAAANGPEAPPAGQLHAPPLPSASEKAVPPRAADPAPTKQEAAATDKAPQHELGRAHAPAPAAPAPAKEPPAETDFSFSTPAQPHAHAAETTFGAPPARKEEPAAAAYGEEEAAPVAGRKADVGEGASFDVDVEKAGGRQSSTVATVAKAALAAAVVAAGAVLAKNHIDSSAESKKAAEPAPVTRAKGFWKRE